MSTPEEKFETARDGSGETEERERAIDELGTANECDRLAELVRMDDLEDRYRERALSGLAHPQCRLTLESLVESGDLPGSLLEEAESLLDGTPEDAGAGP